MLAHTKNLFFTMESIALWFPVYRGGITSIVANLSLTEQKQNELTS